MEVEGSQEEGEEEDASSHAEEKTFKRPYGGCFIGSWTDDEEFIPNIRE